MGRIGTKRIKVKFKKGLSLIELLVSVFVLTLILLTVVTVAVGYIKGKIKIQKYQQDVEDLSIVLNEMSKKLRMSNCDADMEESCGLCIGDNSRIRFYKNTATTSSCNYYDYALEDGKLVTRENGNMIDLLENVEGFFYTVSSSSPGGVPRVTMTIWKSGRPETAVQTTVSLRSGYNQK